ncbi:hypothetical protein U91I_00109 [alpha proteobacterium U9-1i]|nr:hypothetical protein U91I_00109 [alpha proteobacterium U9-1i]
MSDQISKRRREFALGLGAAAAASLIPNVALAQEDTYSEDEVLRAAQRFFGGAAEGLADVVHHVFAQNGRPVGYIQGQEGSGAIGVGLRYGDGHLRMRSRSGASRVYWRGPSVGFDTGGDAAKVFTLVYGMTSPDQIYRRFPGVEGSAYFVGGVGVNYQRADDITLAPMRAGVGFRLGANIGYLAYSRRRIYNPF